MALAFLFPGQGSQSPGMLEGFPDPDGVVATTLEEGSDALGWDLGKLVREGPEEELNRTENTQPALLAAGVAVARLWRHRGGPMPAFMAGHSLGEYSALVAAGSLDFPSAAQLVAERARFMQEAVPQGKGGMAAVLGLDDATVRELCDRIRDRGVVQPANFNAPGQVVVAGQKEAVAALLEAASRAGAKRTVELPVSIPSHCTLMEPAAQRLKERLAQTELQAPGVPVVTNVDAAPLRDADSVRDALIRQLASPVLWAQGIQLLRREGVVDALEMGPGKVLCGLNRRIDRAMTCHALQDQSGLDEALQALGAERSGNA